MWRAAQTAGVTTMVLKAHEGSSAERAYLAGDGVVGGVVLNSPVGGPNPDAVRVSHLLGGRVVWLPTISAEAHLRASRSEELSAHAGIRFRAVPVVSDGVLRAEWCDVLDEVAAADLVLVAGHLLLDETITVFTEARRRGVRRLLVNHPGLPFLGWRDEHADALRALGARLEIGVTCDLICGQEGRPTAYFARHYPHELLVFGSDLGHSSFPALEQGYRQWISDNRDDFGAVALERIMTSNGRDLLD
jgi:hypothetical protein